MPITTRRPAVTAPRAAEPLAPTRPPEGTSAAAAGGDSFAAAGPGERERVFPPGTRRRGSWEWTAGSVSSPAVLDALISSQKATGATELYLNAYPVVGRERFLADALTRASSAGLAPQLLLGAPEWSDPATRPWLTTSIIAPLKAVHAARGAPVTLHLDIEPHATGPLTEQKKRDYLDTLDWLRATLGPGFTLEVDLPAWYANEELDGKSLTAEILARVGGATLMAYERTAAQVLADVTPTVDLAASLGKQVMVALEVGPQYARVGLGTQSGARQALLQLDQALASRPGYGGCALHGIDALKLLPR